MWRRNNGISCNEKEFALLYKEHEIKHECSENLLKGHFSNIVLTPGHIELNLGRLFLKFLWTSFLLNIVKKLGFQTDKVQPDDKKPPYSPDFIL